MGQGNVLIPPHQNSTPETEIRLTGIFQTERDKMVINHWIQIPHFLIQITETQTSTIEPFNDKNSPNLNSFQKERKEKGNKTDSPFYHE